MAINVFVKSGGTTLEEVSATTKEVLSGYTYNDSEGEVQTGTMPNNGAINKTINVGERFRGNAGYYSSIKITGPTLTGNAEVSNVLADKTFYSNSGTIQIGTMPNRGIVNETIGIDESYSGLEGYYSSINITGPSLTGNATVDNVLSGQTFYSNSGEIQTGTMVNRGALTYTINNMVESNYPFHVEDYTDWSDYNKYTTSNAGYYSSITINCDWIVYTKTQPITGNFSNTNVTVTGYYGVSTDLNPNSNSFKVFECGGYIWITRNRGTDNGTARIVKIWKP